MYREFVRVGASLEPTDLLPSPIRWVRLLVDLIYGRLTLVHRGKTLGGSSSINGGTWTRGMKAQYDAFTAFLEPEDADKGWDWEGLFYYMKKVCTSLAPFPALTFS